MTTAHAVCQKIAHLGDQKMMANNEGFHAQNGQKPVGPLVPLTFTDLKIRKMIC